MRAMLFAVFLTLLLLVAEGFSGPSFHPACLGTAAVLRPFRGIAQARAPSLIKGKLPHLNTCLPGSSCSSLLRPSTRGQISVLVRYLSSGPTDDASPEPSAPDRSGPGSDGGLEQPDQAMEKAEGKLESEKEELKRAKEELEAAEGKLVAATDPGQKALAQKAYERAEIEYDLAVKNVNTARRAVDIALDAVQRAGAAGPVGSPTLRGTQVAAPENGLRQVLQAACPMGMDCECAQMRNTYQTEKLTWQNQKIVDVILRNGKVPVFLERQAQLEQVVRLMLERQGNWESDKQKNPLLCVPNSPGTGKSLFAAMLGQALEAGCLEDRSVAEVLPTLTAERVADDGNFSTVVSAFTYNSEMNVPLEIENHGAALYCRALYGALGAKCSQLKNVRFNEFADAVLKQKMWIPLKSIRDEYKALTGGPEFEKTNFVLVVDELAKINNLEDPSDSARQTMTELGAWLDASPNHHAVVTALHEQFVRTGVTGSNRNVEVAAIVTDLSCVNGNAKELMSAFQQALGVNTMTRALSQNLQRTIALTSGHVRSLDKLQRDLVRSNSQLRDEMLRGRRAGWQTLARLGLEVWADDVGAVVVQHLKDCSQRDQLWKAISDVVLCRQVRTYSYQLLIESGVVQLAGSESSSEKTITNRIDSKALALLCLLHAASAPGCHKLDPRVRQLAILLFDETANAFVVDGLPTDIDETKCIDVFARRRMSSSAERAVCWGLARMLERGGALRSKLLGRAIEGPLPPKHVSVVLPSQDEDDASFNLRLLSLDAEEWQMHIPPDFYPAADLYAVRRNDERVAVQVKIDWDSSATQTKKQKRIYRVRQRVFSVKEGKGPLQVLPASRFVLVICSEAVSAADIVSLTAPSTTSDELPVDEVLVGEDLAKVLPRSLMRLTWMGIPGVEDDDSDESSG